MQSSNFSELERNCLRIYRETKEFKAIAELCENSAFTFEIMMGPPIARTPALFIGYQPGDWELCPLCARRAGYEEWWVKQECHYADAKWLLARKLRDIFDEKFLAKCVGTNAIFVRAKNVATYFSVVKRAPRREIKEFCIRKVFQLIDLIDPNRIIIIGFGTAGLFGPVTPDPANPKVLKSLRIGNREALAVKHLTGARLTSEEFETVRTRLRGYCGLPET